jgi:SAM-dependent methyltransferase
MIRSLVPGLSLALGFAIVAALPTDTSAQMRMEKRKRLPELIYVPTPLNVVDKMLQVAKVTKDDYVFDLGSGDGRIPIMAAMRYGARGLGVEINPKLVAEARSNARQVGVSDRVKFRRQDLFQTSVREATVVALYLFVWANEKLRPRLVNELRPGSRIVAHDFPVGDDWKPDIEEDIDNRTVYLWYVPAQVAGAWQVAGTVPGLTLQLQQTFQMIDGTATVDGRTVPLRNASLRGDEIEFTIPADAAKPMLFRGKVSGDRIEPRSNADGAMRGWSAVRTSPAATPSMQMPAEPLRVRG